jgi:hypothetical protein
VTVDPVRGAEADVPLSGIPAGEYLLEVAASAEPDAPRTLVAFRVTG